jgi:hypothetical protein
MGTLTRNECRSRGRHRPSNWDTGLAGGQHADRAALPAFPANGHYTTNSNKN